MTTSLVTGGAGFLGSHLVDVLAKRGESVIVLDNLTTGRLGNLAGAISSGRVTFIYCDVAVEAAALRDILVRAKVGKVDAIYHLATAPSPSGYGTDPWETMAVNGLGTASLIEIALDQQARFVFGSSAGMYRDTSIEQNIGTSVENVDSIEAAVTAAVPGRGLDGRIVRFFNCYGPRMQIVEGRLIPALLQAVLERRPLPIYGLGDRTRCITFVDDAIELLLLVATRPQENVIPVDIANGDERTDLDIAKTLTAVLSMEFVAEFIEGSEDGLQHRRPDLTRARSLGWSPRTPLEKGLRTTHDWFAKESQIFV